MERSLQRSLSEIEIEKRNLKLFGHEAENCYKHKLRVCGWPLSSFGTYRVGMW